MAVLSTQKIHGSKHCICCQDHIEENRDWVGTIVSFGTFFFFSFCVGGGGVRRGCSEIETAVQRSWKLNCGTNC